LSKDELDEVFYKQHQRAMRGDPGAANSRDEDHSAADHPRDGSDRHPTISRGNRFDVRPRRHQKRSADREENGKLTAASASQICDGASE